MKRIGFATTTHDITIYIAVYKPTGETFYLLIQVDEFSLDCYNLYVAEGRYNQIGGDIQFPGESNKPFTHLGIFTDFNGIDIEQSRDYIQISRYNHIYRVMISQCCNEWKLKVPAKTPSPLPSDSLKQLFSNYGRKEGTK